MKIRIELLSDLCTASGETYNSIVDTDVEYDTLGLPYIPAKRIKGCIREAALEMKDFGIITSEDFLQLFGKEGNASSAFTLSNAYIQNYKETAEALNACKALDYVSQQAVLDKYTTLRTQTAVDLETGVAEGNSLRTMRVVNKGLVFEAECNIKDSSKAEVLGQAISLVKHIGLARTRGLGLVRMELEKGDVAQVSHVQVEKSKLYDKNKLSYTITLQSAMICKSAQGNQAETQDYIAGSKVLGIIAGAVGPEGYKQMTSSGELVVSNAYITYDGKRCAVGPFSLQKEKDQPWKDGAMTVVDMRYIQDRDENGHEDPLIANKQMTPAGLSYMGADGSKVDVSTEISYHHQRPEDKSVGRATGEDGSSFYQLCSISAGQSFSGYIYANRSQAEQIIDALSDLGQIRMGYGKSSEFGAVDFVIDQVEEVTPQQEIVHEAAITLASDVILYNEDGFLSTELSVLAGYLNDALGISDINIEKPFLDFTTVGGYNVTWQARKPIFKAFAKGTSFIIKSQTGFDLSILNKAFIGERVAEGYGEVIATKLGTAEVVVRKPSVCANANIQVYGSCDIIQALLQTEFERRLQEEIMEILDGEKVTYKKQPAGFNAAVAKLRVMFKNETSYEAMLEQVDGIESEGKRGLCMGLLELVNPVKLKNDIAKQIETDYKLPFIQAKKDQDQFKYVYRIYITELKHFAKILDKEVAANGK